MKPDTSPLGIESTADKTIANDSIVQQHLDNGAYTLSFQQLDKILSSMVTNPPSKDRDVLFISISLEFAGICFALGKGFQQLNAYLQDALQASDRVGDRRSRAMVNLHLGRLFYFSEQRAKAMEAFSAGKTEVDALGDDDISPQASELIGLFYFIQGHFKEAEVYFEQATRSFELGQYGHSGPMWLSYCYIFLGHFNRAIGTLDYYRRVARGNGNEPLATTLRAVLGICLVKIKKLKEATFHLSGALQEAIQQKNDFAVYFARGGLAFYHMTEGRLEDAREWMMTAVTFGAKLGLIKQYASPFVLEIMYELHSHRLAPIPDFSFESEIERICQEPNIHLIGVALRLKAMDGLIQGEELGIVRSKLQQSEKYLVISGDPVQLAKTRIEIARLSLKQGSQTQARHMALKAWKGLAGYGDIFFPDDLRHLLGVENGRHPDLKEPETMLQRFTEIIDELVLSNDLNELLAHTVKATNRFLGAERGGVFWFDDKKSPRLIAAHNLFESDISSKTFRSSLELIFKAFHGNTPLIKHRKVVETRVGRTKAMLAVPFEVKGKARGILYHDNAYIDDCFSYFSKNELAGMANYLSKYVNHLLNLTRRIEEKASKNYTRLGEISGENFISQSPVMEKKLKQVDKIAGTDSTVLVLGETGVGKELIARRIHERSLRKDYPLVVVDPTSIPETLIESELFGHEKGAFTGADKQRTGRVELAHKGTLFIDEVGEIPLSIQVKLLRALQEKTIVRLGGSTTIHSDFRLIAATNRDLQKEVAKGNFREDLFYRLNVIPIEIPPLRKRGEDILLIAEYFLKKFRMKYNFPMIEFTPENKVMLLEYNWPGNIRELNNIIERAVLLSEEDQLAIELKTKNNRSHPDDLFQDRPSLDEMQRRYISAVLEECNGQIGGPEGAAQRLGMKRTSLYARMRTLGMR